MLVYVQHTYLVIPNDPVSVDLRNKDKQNLTSRLPTSRFFWWIHHLEIEKELKKAGSPSTAGTWFQLPGYGPCHPRQMPGSLWQPGYPDW